MLMVKFILNDTPIAKTMTKAEVRTKIDIGGSLFMVQI